MASFPIPVVLGRQRPGKTDDFVGRPPVIMVHVGCDETWSPVPGHLPAHNGKAYFALIDTGAEGTAIDKSVASEIGVALKRNGLVVHAMDGPRTDMPSCKIQIIFPTIGAVFAEVAAVLDYHSAGNTFDLVLGRSFLKMCSLYLDPPAHAYRLEWIV